MIIGSSQGQGHSCKKAQNFLFPQYKTSVDDNSNSIENGAVKFACSIKWCDSLLCHVIGNTHVCGWSSLDEKAILSHVIGGQINPRPAETWGVSLYCPVPTFSLIALNIIFVKTTTCTLQWVVSRRTNVFASRDWMTAVQLVQLSF